MKNRYYVMREQTPRYAVAGFQAARWSVCDNWDDGKPVGFGIRKYDATNIARWLNRKNETSPLPRHSLTDPYWEWRDPRDYLSERFPHILRAKHHTSSVGSFRRSAGKATKWMRAEPCSAI